MVALRKELDFDGLQFMKIMSAPYTLQEMTKTSEHKKTAGNKYPLFLFASRLLDLDCYVLALTLKAVVHSQIVATTINVILVVHSLSTSRTTWCDGREFVEQVLHREVHTPCCTIAGFTVVGNLSIPPGGGSYTIVININAFYPSAIQQTTINMTTLHL